MKILITGAFGQLGNEITRFLNTGSCFIGQINSLYMKSNIIKTGSSELDISCLKDVLKFAVQFKPDLIINASAYTNVDGCEVNPQRAFSVNSIGSRNLAMAAEAVNAKLVTVSTDYVFSGEANIPYREYDLPGPINVYGKSKLLGEEYVKQFCSRYFIIRTSWLYGHSDRNFIAWAVNNIRHNAALKVVNDQRGNPTNAEDLVYHIFKIAESREYGIYHCSGKGECSRYEIVKKIIDTLKTPCSLSAIKSTELKQLAKRPAYSSLDNMMLRCTLGDEMRNWEEALERYLGELQYF